MTPTLVIGLGGVALAVLTILAWWLGNRRAARSRREVEERLDLSRRDVAQLAEQVARLASQMEARRRDAVADREYVVTTLAEATEVTGVAATDRGVLPAAEVSVVDTVAEGLERQAVARLAEVDTTTRLGARVADVGVRALALAHGVRRALAQENRDRASAEALVARRRSRRTRRQELREARRLLRAVRAQQPAARQRAEDAA
jgi:hypothetical protein